MKNNQYGFGMVEAMISAVVLGGIGYLVLQQTDVLNKTKMKADFNQELSEISIAIKESLSDPDICKAIVENVTIGSIERNYQTGGIMKSGSRSETAQIGLAVGGVIEGTIYAPSRPVAPTHDPGPLNWLGQETSPHDSAPVEVARIGKEFGSGAKIQNMQLINDGTRNFIRLTFEKSERFKVGALGGSTITKDFLIKGQKDPTANRLLNCSAGVVIDPKTQCKSLKDSTWDQKSEKCIMGQHLKKNERVLVPVYVSAAGKLITEDLVPTTTEAKCKCSSRSCAKDPNCTCNPGLCPSPLRTESPPRRETRNHDCLMVATCMQVKPIPPGTVPVGYFVR